jgi:predicted HAD superfamily Cof-like phosphohydrolase|tara:strand:+ start:11342 stop:11797 length:456 start_codon:yes stop_codon:yes gene_type:complete
MGWWKQTKLLRKKYMSDNWVNDIEDMHDKFGVHDWFQANRGDKDLMQKYLMFRMLMIGEEYQETLSAINNSDAEEVVDGLIDMCVFAIGTLDVMGVDANKAWNAIYEANMAKEPGVKPGRPNRFGLPDLLKPSGWTPPSHEGNHGDLPSIV